jgi:TolB-like protein
LALALAAAPKPTVAVLYFDYEGKTEGMAMLQKGLAQMLITDLTANDSLRVVERARLQEILDELKLNQTAKVDASTATKIGKLLGARYMVMGGYFDLLGTLRVDARVVETETGKIVKSTGAKGKPDDFMDLEQKIARELEVILTSAAVEKTGEAPPASKPKARVSTNTALRYSKALDAIDKKDKKTAKQALEDVLKEQPDFTLASLDLAALAK